MLVEKKFGSRLSEASPAYQKYKMKVSKKTANLTRGDDVTISFHSDHIMMKDKKSSDTVRGDVTELNICCLCFCVQG